MSRNGDKRVALPCRRPGSVYNADSYGTVVARACDRADVPHWHPNQLRHLFATEVRRRYGLEAAQVALKAKGHAGPFKKGFNRAGRRAIDFVATGGMVICPPSRHPSGERRGWAAVGEARPVPAVVPFPVLWEQVCRLAHAIGCDPLAASGGRGSARGERSG